MSKDDDLIDLSRADFTRGELRGLEMRSIAGLFDAVESVLGLVNDGKEATVYLCGTRPGLVREPLAAAKMFRAEKFRGFRNAVKYMDTSRIPDRRAAKAVRKGTRLGKLMSHGMWVEREWVALERLHAAGVSVPRPYARAGAGILMEYLGDAAVAAPNLIEARLDRAAAMRVWSGLQRDIEGMLDCGLIHGDLSGYNVLYWQERARVIDLPQAVDAATAPNAFELLHRDLDNVTRPLVRAGLEVDPLDAAMRLARRYL
jgi:RIO kinase 1